MENTEIIQEESDDMDENEVDAEFFNQCSQFFQKITNSSNDIAKERYLGFIEKDDIIFIVFNCSNLDILETVHTDNSEYEIGIIDEIINKKKILDIPIEPTIADLFSSSKLITYIYSGQGIELPYPKSVYLCQLTETGEYKNAYYTGSQKSISIVSPKIELPFFGSVYLFSSEPLISGPKTGVVQEIVQTLTNTSDILKRYSLFIDAAKIYKEVDPIEIADKNYLCYGFIDKGHELWAVKSVTLFKEI
jgi:hypothetical protein